MLRRIIGITEEVYYRGRFRASLAWSKASRREGESEPLSMDDPTPQIIREPDRTLLGMALPGKTEKLGLKVKPAGP